MTQPTFNLDDLSRTDFNAFSCEKLKKLLLSIQDVIDLKMSKDIQGDKNFLSLAKRARKIFDSNELSDFKVKINLPQLVTGYCLIKENGKCGFEIMDVDYTDVSDKLLEKELLKDVNFKKFFAKFKEYYITQIYPDIKKLTKKYKITIKEVMNLIRNA